MAQMGPVHSLAQLLRPTVDASLPHRPRRPAAILSVSPGRVARLEVGSMHIFEFDALCASIRSPSNCSMAAPHHRRRSLQRHANNGSSAILQCPPAVQLQVGAIPLTLCKPFRVPLGHRLTLWRLSTRGVRYRFLNASIDGGQFLQNQSAHLACDWIDSLPQIALIFHSPPTLNHSCNRCRTPLSNLAEPH